MNAPCLRLLHDFAVCFPLLIVGTFSWPKRYSCCDRTHWRSACSESGGEVFQCSLFCRMLLRLSSNGDDYETNLFAFHLMSSDVVGIQRKRLKTNARTKHKSTYDTFAFPTLPHISENCGSWPWTWRLVDMQSLHIVTWVVSNFKALPRNHASTCVVFEFTDCDDITWENALLNVTIYWHETLVRNISARFQSLQPHLRHVVHTARSRISRVFKTQITKLKNGLNAVLAWKVFIRMPQYDCIGYIATGCHNVHTLLDQWSLPAIWFRINCHKK